LAVNLKAMSRKELIQLQKDVQKALVDADARDRAEARKAAEKAVAEFGFSLSEISGGSATGKKGKGTKTPAIAKYRNPENAEQTWSGRGRKPRWLNDAVAAGVSIEALEI